VVCLYQQLVEKIKETIHCWKVDVDDDDPHDIPIKDSKGERVLMGKAT